MLPLAWPKVLAGRDTGCSCTPRDALPAWERRPGATAPHAATGRASRTGRLSPLPTLPHMTRQLSRLSTQHEALHLKGRAALAILRAPCVTSHPQIVSHAARFLVSPPRSAEASASVRCQRACVTLLPPLRSSLPPYRLSLLLPFSSHSRPIPRSMNAALEIPGWGILILDRT